MGKMLAGALLGAVGCVVVAGCSGSAEDLTLPDEPNPVGSTSMDSESPKSGSGTAVDDAGNQPTVDGSVTDAGVDASNDAASVDASIVDAGSDANDAGPTPPPTFELPARLVIEQDGSVCWSAGAEIGKVCKPIPAFDPPIVRTNDQCGTPTKWPIVHVRVPVGACATIQGQWSNACIVNPSEPATGCGTVTNKLKKDIEGGWLYKRIIVNWQSGATCACPTK